MNDPLIWKACGRCSFLQRCHNPFPPDGVCPHPDRAEPLLILPLVNQPVLSHEYATLLSHDPKVGSLFHRWRRGYPPTNGDYLCLREYMFDGYRLRQETPATAVAAGYLLMDILNEVLGTMTQDFIRYYLAPDAGPGEEPARFQLNTLPLTTAGNLCLHLAIWLSDRTFIERHARLGGEWTRCLLDLVRSLSWHALQQHLPPMRHLQLDTLKDAAFRKAFEVEWRRLLPFQDPFYGFNVVPRLSLDHMVRYQLLANGRPEIRAAITTYFTHQATEYPQLLSTLAGNEAVRGVFERRLQRMYEPLIESTTRAALRNLEITKDTEAEQAVRNEVLQEFDRLRHEFEFYWEGRRSKRPYGTLGLVGFPVTAEARKEFDALAQQRGLPFQSSDFGEVGFAHYIAQNLKAWLKKRYPADAASGEIVSSEVVEQQLDGQQLEEHSPGQSINQGAVDNEEFVDDEGFVGEDGIVYIQRRAAARFYGVGEEQLRTWDRRGLYPATGAKEVLRLPWPAGITKKTRLYPKTQEAQDAVEMLKLRTATYSSTLRDQEVTRQIASRLTGVPIGTLMDWEKQGKVCPSRRGGVVVYSPEAIAQVQELRSARRKKSK